jgi:hypothetical protein
MDFRIGLLARGIENLKAHYAATSSLALKRLMKRNAGEPSR